ncbi:tetratricopeptide repeat protein [bacterium]|nr:tetratricopeptide repeat protein [bacterium]
MTSLVKKASKNRSGALAALLLVVLICSCTVLSSVSPLPTCALTQAEDNQLRSHINAGNHYLARRLYDEAINEYEAALKIDPECRIAKDNIALVHNNKGTDYFSRRLYQEAQKEWQTALSLNPNDAIARRNLQVLAVHMRHQRENQLRLQEQAAQEAEEKEEEQPVREAEASRKKEIEEKKEEPPKPTIILSTGSSQVKMSDDGKLLGPQNSEDAFSENSEEHSTAPSVDSVINDSLSTLNALKEKKRTTTQMKVVTVVKPAAPVPSQTKTDSEALKEPKEQKEQKEQKNSDRDDQKLTISLQLSRLEKEVFGEERRDDPILKRLLHLEKDTLGKKQSGTVKERLKRLNETYGFRTY